MLDLNVKNLRGLLEQNGILVCQSFNQLVLLFCGLERVAVMFYAMIVVLQRALTVLFCAVAPLWRLPKYQGRDKT
eukprot:13504258-Ditylum_brightwellii.AAC.1